VNSNLHYDKVTQISLTCLCISIWLVCTIVPILIVNQTPFHGADWHQPTCGTTCKPCTQQPRMACRSRSLPGMGDRRPGEEGDAQITDSWEIRFTVTDCQRQLIMHIMWPQEKMIQELYNLVQLIKSRCSTSIITWGHQVRSEVGCQRWVRSCHVYGLKEKKIEEEEECMALPSPDWWIWSSCGHDTRISNLYWCLGRQLQIGLRFTLLRASPAIPK